MNLSHNRISDIKVLQKAKFEKLVLLNLSWNQLLNNVNILENVNFKELKELDLSFNDITDINVFKKANFKNLNNLCLNRKNIDISSLTSLNRILKAKIQF